MRTEGTKWEVKREFIVERQGRSFVLYAGLLDLAHRQGLRAVRTRLLQIPASDNGDLAIVHAEVETERGLFSGIGDAAPQNVGRAMVHCIVRLAETRAKARALRDAVNVGVAALEELGDDESDAEASPARSINEGPPRPADTAAPRMLPPRGQPMAVAGSGVATPAQIRAIYLIARDQYGLADAEIDERCAQMFGAPPSELTKKQASEFISHLKGA
ncbi:MAG: hypothetical protein HYY04_00125 [Chloroflexi bacterium]|nr:hypothetical protein [Chloroflexota bacterium]